MMQIDSKIMLEIFNQKVLADHLEYLFNLTQVGVYWKDNRGRYLGVNSEFLRHSSRTSPDDIIGGTDFDFWAQYAPGLRKNDEEVIYTENPKFVIERCVSLGKETYFQNFKSPFYTRDGKIMGVFGVVTLLNTKESNKKRIKFHPLEKLTKRQTECLYYVTKGKTAIEIAKILSLSSRTVGHYIEAIKDKWNCKGRSELIEKAELYFGDSA